MTTMTTVPRLPDRRVTRAGRSPHRGPAGLARGGAGALRQRGGQPVGVTGALAGVAAVVVMLTMLHLTCTPAACPSAAAARTERSCYDGGLTAIPDHLPTTSARHRSRR